MLWQLCDAMQQKWLSPDVATYSATISREREREREREILMMMIMA